MQISRIILASASKFRSELLATTGLKFECQTARVDEKKILAKTPAQVAHERSIAKAHEVARRFPDTLVIGADQVLEFDGKVIDKASSAEEARSRISEFAGQMHVLQSGYCLVMSTDGHVKTLHAEVVPAHMHMRKLAKSEIETYVKTGEWEGCVGCYRYEGKGINLFQKIVGEQSTIVGLPLVPLLNALRKIGIDPLTSSHGPWQVSLRS